MPIIRKLNSKAVILGPSNSESVSSAHIVQDNGVDVAQRARLNFAGAGVSVTDDSGNGRTTITIPGGAGSSGSIVPDLRLGQDITSATPVACYPKVKKTITIDATNNKLAFDEGGSALVATITSGTYVYPYTSLALDIKTQMESLGANTYTVSADQQHWKIESDNNFNIDKSVSNSITTTLGFVSVDTETNSGYYRADAIHLYSHQVMLLPVNTTNDSSPPYIDDGLFSTQVAADHRSRSFSGFILSDGSAYDQKDLYISGPVDGFSALSFAEIYYTNGTNGEISLSSVANSLQVGYASEVGTIVLDPHDKGFEFVVEPDTDVIPDTIDDEAAWLSEPEMVSAASADTVSHGFCAEGDYVIVARHDVSSPASLRIMWSVDGGDSFKEYGTTFPTAINMTSSSDLTYWQVQPRVWCNSAGKVFIAYYFTDGSFYETRGVYGTIDSNGELTLAQTNDGLGGIFEDSISANDATNSILPIRIAERNGYLYVLLMHVGKFMYLYTSTNYGQTFNGISPIGNSGIGNVKPLVIATNDYAPVQLMVTGQPASPSDNRVAVVYSADDTNGDPVVSANYRLSLVYQDANTPTSAGWLGIDLGNPAGVSRWSLAIGWCWSNAAETKAALNIILGHGNAIAAGTDTTGISNNNRSYVGLLDLSVTTPTFSSGAVPYYDSTISFTGGRVSYYNGFTSENTNGFYYGTDPNNIVRISDTSLMLTAADSYRGNFAHCYYVPDTSALGINYPVTEWFKSDSFGGNHIQTMHAAEAQLVESGSSKHVIWKATESIANNLTTGKILSQEIDIDSSVKSELITNGTFATDISGWTTDTTTTGTAVFNAGKLRLNSGASNGHAAAYQNITTVPGKTYKFQFNVTAVSVNGAVAVSTSGLTSLNTHGDIFNIGSGLTSATYVFSFIAKSTSTRIHLAHQGGTNLIVDFDDISVKESDVQFGPLIDLAAKPNVDDEDFVGKLQVLSDSDGNAHVLFKKGLNLLDNGTYYEQPVYQSFKIRTEEVANLWENVPHEIADISFTAAVSSYDVKWDPTNPSYGVMVGVQNGASQSYVIRVTTDGGVTWKPASTPAAYTDAVNLTELQWFYRHPAVYINNSKVFISIEQSSSTQIGLYGTISGGELVLSVSNNGVGGNGSAILNIAAGTMFFRQVVENNDKLYYLAARSGGGNARLAVSSDWGATWSDGVTNGSDVSVRSVSTDWAPGNDYSLRLIAVDRPGAPSSNRVAVLASNGSLSLNLYYSDNDNLGSNWATALAVSTTGAGTIGFSGASLSDNMQYLAVGVVKSSFTNKTDLHVVDLSLSTPTSAGGTDIISTFGLALDQYNGSTSASPTQGLHYSRSQYSKFIWTSATSLLMVNSIGIDTSTPRVVISKCSDITNIASTISYCSVFSGTSSSIQATDTQLGKFGSNYWVGFITKNSTTASWFTNGRARAMRVYDPTPTTNVAPKVEYVITNIQEEAAGLGIAASQLGKELGVVDLTYKLSHTNGVKHLIMQSLSDRIVANVGRYNIDGYVTPVCNTFMSRELNPTVDEWAKVPVKVSSLGADISVWAYDKVGTKIIAVAQQTGSNTGSVYYSPNSGASWYVIASVDFNTTHGIGAVTHISQFANVKINSAETKFSILHQKNAGANETMVSIYGEFDSNGDVFNIDSTALTVFNSTANTVDSAALSERNGKLYATGYSQVTGKSWLNISANFGDTSWGTQGTIKTGGTDAAVTSYAPFIFETCSNGSGGDRVIYISKKSAAGSVTMWYTNDDGATWATEISLGISDSQLLGYGRNGNQLAMLVAGNDGASAPNPIYVAYCADITAATPSWSTQVLTNPGTIIGVGLSCESNGSLSGTQTDNCAGHRRSLNRVIWTSSSSFVAIYDGRDTGGIEVPVLLKVPNVATLSTNNQQLLEAVSSVHKLASQLVKSDSGEMYAVYKVTDSASFTNNFTSGRIVGRQIYDPTPTSNTTPGVEGVAGQFLEDLAFKPSATTGGFAGWMIVVGDGLGFLKEDGSGFQQIYWQSLSPKNNARFQ